MASEDRETNNVEEDSSDEASSSSSSESEYAESNFSSGEEDFDYSSEEEDETKDDDSPENNIRRFSEVLDSERLKKKQDEEDREYVYYEDLFDFPKDPEKWREEDLQELWADAPLEATKPGWDPVWADEEDWEIVQDEVKDGKEPPIAPFYLPYRRYYPAIPDNHYDISNPKSVIEELDRIEEFLKWVSYIFPDGSTYEGTVWDDLAHGKGVYVAEHGLVRYEGEWLQNNMEGHGVVEVEIPSREPVPGSKLEEKMRSEGKIISRDFMSPEDREWLEMDIEDSYRLADGRYEIPFDENNEWIKKFGKKPEKGRYRYAGQWKHGRMHGCGVYEVNERPIYGRFYFGELVDDPTGCDEDISALHAGIAEVAAAKARMFVNKPDGMVREQNGPYSDPQHPYFYEGEDVWMAPGFINQFHEVPDYWKTYVHEVDQEREMWLNSFYKAPLRIPMPAELEHWWSKDESPEFVLVNKEPELDPNDPSKVVYTEDPLILHTRTGRLINYIDDEKYGIRLFWQPPLKDGEDVDPKKAEFLPLGFDEFYGKATETAKKGSIWERLSAAFESAFKPVLDKVEKWAEEKKKGIELKIKLVEKELEFVEAELCLEEAIEDLDTELRRKQKEEEKKADMGQLEGEDRSDSATAIQDATVSAENEDADEEEEEEDEDDGEPTSFGSVEADQGQTKGDKGSKSGKSPFSSTSLSFTSCSLLSTVPSKLQQSFLSWKSAERLPTTTTQSTPTCCEHSIGPRPTLNYLSFPLMPVKHKGLKATNQNGRRSHRRNANMFLLHPLSLVLLGPHASNKRKRHLREQKVSNHQDSQTEPEIDWHNVLSLQIPINGVESCTNCVLP